MLLKEIILLWNSIILQAEREHDNCEEQKSALYQANHLITGLEGVVNNKKGAKAQDCHLFETRISYADLPNQNH